MKRVSVWVASAAASLLAVPAVAGEDVESQLAEMQELVKGLQQKVDAQEEQIEHQGQLLQDAQRVVRADEQGSLSSLAAFLDSIEVDGAAIASYNYNFNTPTDGGGGAGQNLGQDGLFLPYHPSANTFQVDQVWFGIGKPATEESRGGFRFDIFWGATATLFAGGFPGGAAFDDTTSDYDIDQAYVEYLAPVADANLKLGKFDTVVGAENNRQWDNFNITHGIVDTLQPVNHLGLIGTVPLGDMAEFGAGVVNSAHSFISSPDDSEEKSYLATLKLGDNRANIRASFLYGSEPSIIEDLSADDESGLCPGGVACANRVGDQLGLVDVTAWFNPTDTVSLWANYDYLYIENTGYYANGIAVAGRVEVLPDFGLALRGEYVREESSPTHGTLFISGNDEADTHATDIWSITGTADYALTEHLKVKSELRWDKANGNGEGADNNQFAESNPDDFKSLDQLVWLIAAEYVF